MGEEKFSQMAFATKSQSLVSHYFQGSTVCFGSWWYYWRRFHFVDNEDENEWHRFCKKELELEPNTFSPEVNRRCYEYCGYQPMVLVWWVNFTLWVSISPVP